MTNISKLKRDDLPRITVLFSTITSIGTSRLIAVASVITLAFISYFYSPTLSNMPSSHVPQPPTLYSFNTSSSLIDSLAEFIHKAQADAIHKKDKFTVALSGGSLPKMLKGLVSRRDIAWDKWYVYAYGARARVDVPAGMSTLQMNASYRSTTKTRTMLSARKSSFHMCPSQMPTSTPLILACWMTPRKLRTRTKRSSSESLPKKTRHASPSLT